MNKDDISYLDSIVESAIQDIRHAFGFEDAAVIKLIRQSLDRIEYLEGENDG